ncbi:nitronate monooxygenase [Streptomyces sp. NBC_00576]|uniref:nitronate monooxygenase n=1 Tax=Streptomyces sp. NBC_00576 TaxID=2903665 RepID=UPI002E804C92|nr:nitronate monooxygenase [Streptomyces sp. NBC_00576]WUB68705.1 nitronate monooxygenase [Streptomyces sp. NBC_00576]
MKPDELANRTGRGSLVGTNKAYSAGHRCSFGSLSVTSTEDRESVQLPDLVAAVRHAAALPVIAAGEIATAADVTAALGAGAMAATVRHRSAAHPGERTRPGPRAAAAAGCLPRDAARWTWSHTGPPSTVGSCCPLRDQRRASIIRNPDSLSLQ